MRFLAAIARVICAVNLVIGNLFSWLALGIVLVCFTVVVQRYVFAISFVWMQDLYIWLNGAMFTAVAGFALLRDFGRGQVLGPIVARDAATARALMSAGATRAAGGFLRVDLADPALAEHATRLGLAHVGGGTAMVKGAAPAATTEYATYALASQALG